MFEGLEIPMNHALLGAASSAARAPDMLIASTSGSGTGRARDALRQRLAVGELENGRLRIAERLHRVQRRNVRAIERGQHARLRSKRARRSVSSRKRDRRAP